MQIGGKKITNIRTYFCGYCTNDLNKIYKNTPKEKRDFPARTVAFSHDNDWYLFDTGYSHRVFENGWRSKLYSLLNPISFSENDRLKIQLKKDGITTIKGIILSHLHPDHIGGLKDFSDTEIMISAQTKMLLQKPKLFDLIFTNLLPADFENRVRVLDITGEYDLFNDGSLILKNVSGHTKGQIGMFLPEHNIFYAADSTWGMDMIDKPMKWPARFLQQDFSAYQYTIEKIKGMQANGIDIIVSHEVGK